MDELDKKSIDSWLSKNASQRKALQSMLDSLQDKETGVEYADVDQEKRKANKTNIMKKITQIFKKLGFLAIVVWLAGSLNIMAQNGDFVPGKVRVKVEPNSVDLLAKSLKTTKGTAQFKTGLTSLDKINTRYAAKGMTRVFPHAGKHEAKHIKHGLHLWYEIEVNSEADMKAVAREYGENEYIMSSEPISVKSLNYDGVVEAELPSAPAMPMSTNDPYLVDQWHLENDGSLEGSVADSDINAFAAWDINTGTPNVVVAIVDGGIDTAHEDLRDNLWVNEAELNGEPGVDDDYNGYVDDVYGYNFAERMGEVTAHDHGTHVAGTVAATNNNGKGVAGVAGGSGNGDGVRMISAQVFSNNGSGNFASAIVYGADNGAVISQNSWGYQTAGQYEQAVLDAIDYFIEEAGNFPGSPMKGGVVLFAAGNNGQDQMHYPSYYENTIAIASTGSDYKKAPYSNFGTWVDLTTTGGNVYQGTKSQVLSTMPGNRYGYMQGTSMATPHASGIAALVVSEYGGAGSGFTNEDLKKRLLTGVREIDAYNPGFEGMLGAGFMDATLALAANDEQAPEKVADFALVGTSEDFATVQFTVPADAGDGTPYLYRIYWSKDPTMNSSKEKLVPNEFKKVGDLIEITTEGLDFETTYYFAVIAEDRWGNVSEMSDVVAATTNSGPDIATDVMSLTANIDVTSSMNASDAIKVLNNDEGILHWTAETREVSNFASFTRAELPARGTVKSVAQMDVRQQEIEIAEQFELRDAALNAWEASEMKYFTPYPTYIVGDIDTTVTNSSATKFVVSDPEGFNMTYVQAYLNLDEDDGPAVLEIYKGEQIQEDNLIYSDDRFAGRGEDDSRNYAVNLSEQLFFEQGETFWVVFHAPAGNLYPLGMSGALSPEYSDNSFMSFDLGESWVPLAAAVESEGWVWSVTVASKTEPLHKYMTLTPNEGRIAGIGEENMDVAIDGSNLINGTYRSNVVINSNDDDTPIHRVSATVNVTGHKPVLSTNNILDFGSVFNGLSSTKEMTIINSGLGRFRTQTVTSSNPAFTVNSSTWALNVAAKSEATMSLTYTPTGVGNENAVITMTSQNGDVHTFNVFGVGTEPAELTVEPAVINLDDVMIGDAPQANLTISNTGSYPLQYGFPAFAEDLSHIENLPESAQRYNYVMETMPYDGYVFNDITASGTDITQFFKSDVRNEFYNVELGFNFPFYGENIEHINITKRGILTLGQDGNFNSTSQFHGSSMPDGYISGVLREWQLSLAGSIHVKRELGKFIVQYTNVRHANDRDNVAITFQIELYNNGDIKLIYDKFDGLASYQLRSFYSAIENREKNDGVLINSNFDKVELPMAAQQIVHIHSPGLGMVKDVVESAGMIQPGESKELTLMVDPDKLIEGTHTEYVSVLSNDPFNSSQAIEVNINVIGGGVSELILDQSEVAFGDVFQTAEVKGVIAAKNQGSKQINIADISFANGLLTYDGPTSITLEPNQTLYVDYVLNTQSLGAVDDTLIITDDQDNTYEVTFTGQIVNAPAIEVVETSYNETMAPNEELVRSFQVNNPGEATLEYAIASSEYLELTEAGATTTAVNVPELTYVYRSTYDDTSKPSYQWIRLTEEDKVPFRVADGIYYEEVALPFEFTFYGNAYSKIQMGTQGVLTFDENIDKTYAPFSPPMVPNNDVINNMIAPYFAAGGPNTTLPEERRGRYAKAFEDKIVFEWRGYLNIFGIGGEIDFQAILYKNGTIKFQYKNNPNTPARAFYGLIGLENEDGTEGVQIAHYQTYVDNGVAVDFYPAKKEILEAGQSRSYDLTINTNGVNSGSYEESLKVINNTPQNSEVTVPVNLEVTGDGELTFVPGTIEMGERMITPDAQYVYDFQFKNTGTRTMTVSNVRVEDGASASVEQLVYSFRWGWSWQTIQSTAEFTVEPGFESETLRLIVTPQEANPAYTNKIIVSTDFGADQELLITGDIKLPPVFTVNDEAVHHMAYDNTVYAHTLSLENLEGESPLKYSMGMNYPRENVAPAANPGSTGGNATLLRNKLSTASTIVAAPLNTDFATVLAHDDASEAYTSVGYNGVTEFMGSTRFVAPETGFNLSHVQTWYVPGEWLNSDIKVEIRVGDHLENADVLYQESINYTISTPDSDGKLLTLELSEVVELLPYEKFYVVITYPLGATFPQGMVRLAEPMTDTFMYYASGFWYDLGDSFADDGFMVRAAETTKAERNWLSVAGEVEGEVAVGGTLDVNLELHPDRTSSPFNFASLSIDTNDPFNSSVTIPVTLEINQGPELIADEMYVVSENETLNLELKASDYEEDVVVGARLTGNSENARVTLENETIFFTYSPGYEDSGYHTFEIVLEDANGVEATSTLQVEVLDANRKPESIAPAKQYVDLYTETYELQFSEVFTDPDGDAMSFEAVAAVEGIVDITYDNAGMKVTPLQLGITEIVLKGMDDRNGETTVSFELEVINVNEAPVAETVEKVTLNLYTGSYRLNFNDVISDPEQDPLSFLISAASEGVVDLFFNESSVLITPLKLGTTMVTLHGADDRDGEVSTTFEVEVVGNITNGEDLSNSWKVHPNPVEDVMNIKMYTPVMETMNVYLYNTMGVLVKTFESKGADVMIEVPVQDLTPGIYFVELVTENAKSVKKIIKK